MNQEQTVFLTNLVNSIDYSELISGEYIICGNVQCDDCVFYDSTGTCMLSGEEERAFMKEHFPEVLL